jgi:DNA primase
MASNLTPYTGTLHFNDINDNIKVKFSMQRTDMEKKRKIIVNLSLRATIKNMISMPLYFNIIMRPEKAASFDTILWRL